MEDEEEKTDKQLGNSKVPTQLQPFQWRKGQSGNIAGRPKGKTMKEYAREMLECQTEEERQDFLHGLPKEVIWKMAEGNWESKGEMNVTGLVINFADDFNKNANSTPKAKGDNKE